MSRDLTHENAAEAWREMRDPRRASRVFTAFALRTTDEWQRTARWLLQRWQHVPRAVEQDDVVQQLLWGAYDALLEWSSEGGMPLRGYVRWVAISRAKRWIHQQRNAKRRDGKAPGRYEISAADLAGEAEFGELPELPDDPQAEAWAELAMAGKRLAPADRELFEAIARYGGDLEGWGFELLASQRSREAAGVSTLRQAKELGMLTLARAERVIERNGREDGEINSG